jgi:hypothetical protein
MTRPQALRAAASETPFAPPKDPAALEAIATGEHSDPFSVLGTHPIKGGWATRVFAPGADAAELEDESGKRQSMSKLHEAGVFGAISDQRLGRYSVIARNEAAEWRSIDPYQFGPGRQPTRRSRSTRSTCRAGADGPTASWPTSWCPTSRRWASPISRRCRSPNIPSTAHGAISRSACTRRPSATARRGVPRFRRGLPREGIGLILDWVPAHFPADPHGLAKFDGTHLYEHADPREGFHPDWNTLIYNYGRREVANFLTASRSTGCASIMSTGCASMPSPRCSTATTPARRASGFPTASAGARTSRRRLPAR